jgi:hypothetical protein
MRVRVQASPIPNKKPDAEPRPQGLSGFERPLYPPTALRSIGGLIYMFLGGADIDLAFSLRLD